MDLILQELSATMPSLRELARVIVRLLAALAVGALIGYERERVGKAAGLRTHMLVSLGTALFVISALEFGMGEDAVSRVIQGLVTGIGFLGAGVIMKGTTHRPCGGGEENSCSLERSGRTCCGRQERCDSPPCGDRE